jgi:aubergine-like protein
MRRGRVLQALSSASSLGRSEEAKREEEKKEDDDKPPMTSVPARPARGRGGFIQRQLVARQTPGEQQVAATSQATHTGGDEPQPARPPSSSSSSSNSRGRLVRQDSDVSRSSAISGQFATVESQNLKANLPKGPSGAGAPIQLGLNYMTFETKEGVQVEEYHVEFNPNIESIKLRYNILRSEESRSVIGTVFHWNGTNLYLPIKLAQKQTIFSSVHPVTRQPIKVRLTFVKTPPVHELLPFYNSLMHKIMNKLDYVIINRQHYSPLHKVVLEQHNLELWPGWITSIQQLDGGIKLSVDAIFKVLRLQTVRDILIEVKNRQTGRLKEALEQELVGTIVMTRYNNRSYRIDEIDLAKNPTATFERSDGQHISFVDYMRQQWNTEVHDLKQPMLVSKPKPKRGQETGDIIYLIPELCVTTGLTDEMRSNFTIMKSIGDNTRLPPNQRERKLSEFLQQLSTDERSKTILGDWGLSVKPQLDVAEGRRLETETVLFGDGKSARVADNADWSRQACGGPVFKTVDIEHWVLMCTERDWRFAEEFMKSIRDVCRSLNIKFHAPRLVKLPNDSTVTYVTAGKQNVRRTDQMVVILTPGKNQREDRYSACKRLYTCELAVPCQFIRCGTISNERKIRSICQKVAIQILSKVGGQPWAMRFPMKSFMIVGIDVYHDTIDRKKSCLGFVASMNEFTSSWWSQTFFQQSLEEIGQKMSSCIATALRRFHALNGTIPQRIIVYRDGVGDGQLDSVLEIEIAQFFNGIKNYLKDCHADEAEPSISYVVVQKRINTKLSLRQNGEVRNPLPGSYIDHTITHPEYNDFYLVSQHVNQGTVSPTKYIILTETGTLKPQHHQKLAYKMTHMYYNWCGTIRVPAPCQYAHKLAYLTGENIRQQASERMEDKLYYL